MNVYDFISYEPVAVDDFTNCLKLVLEEKWQEGLHMMKIIKKQDNGTLTIALEGRLDITTAPNLEKALKDLDGVTELIIDCEKLIYISSAGLRVLLISQKKMNRQGSMKVIHVNEMVMDVFVNMGFADFLTIE